MLNTLKCLPVLCDPEDLGVNENRAYKLSTTAIQPFGGVVKITCGKGYIPSWPGSKQRLQIKCTSLNSFSPSVFKELECCKDRDKDGTCGTRENCDVADLKLPTGYKAVTSDTSINQGRTVTVGCASGYYISAGFKDSVKCENPDSFKAYSIAIGMS